MESLETADKNKKITILLAGIMIIIGLLYIWTNPKYDSLSQSATESSSDSHD